MRPEFSFVAVRSLARAHCLRALALVPGQNQLKDSGMAEIEVGQTSPADTTVTRVLGYGGAFALLGVVVAGAVLFILLTCSIAMHSVMGLAMLCGCVV